MIVLVLNCGSSSVKYKLLDMNDKRVLVTGLADRIGLYGSSITQQAEGKEKLILLTDLPDHRSAVEKILCKLTDRQYGGIDSIGRITAVGHRVVHGGERFNRSVFVTDDILNELEILVELAPLHNPPNITGIRVCRDLIPDTPQVAVFDTAFHQTMPARAYIYSLPYKYYTDCKVRKYGFHGTSHKYVSMRAANILGRPLEELKIITCHLGNGSSICAVDRGKSIDTSMGFTPLAGLPMGTRTGDIDPYIVVHLIEKENLTPAQVNELMNKQSGMLGLSGLSSDFRDLEKAASEGYERARLAIDVFCYSVQKWIGAFAAALQGVDAIVFTAGVGENSTSLRRQIVSGLSWMGIGLDEEKNSSRDAGWVISTADSRVKVLVVPTNEELMIAIETVEKVSGT